MWCVYLKLFNGSLFKVFAHSSPEPRYKFCMMAYISRDFQSTATSGSKSNAFLCGLDPIPPEFA